MNREERYTTVTLTINGESAKRTLEMLSRKAEELGERLRLIQGRGTGDEVRGTGGKSSGWVGAVGVGTRGARGGAPEALFFR